MRLKLCIPVVAASVTAFLGLAPTAQAGSHDCPKGQLCWYLETDYDAAELVYWETGSMSSLALDSWSSVYNNSGACVVLYSGDGWTGEKIYLAPGSGRSSLPWSPHSYKTPLGAAGQVECDIESAS